MRNNLVLLLLVTLCYATTKASTSTLSIDMSQGTPPSGNKLNGPVKIKLERINKLLSVYTVTVQNQNWTANPAVSFDQMQNMPPKSSAPAPKAPVAPAAARTVPQVADDNAFDALKSANDLLNRAGTAADTLKSSLDQIQQLYVRSSNDLSVSRTAMIQDIHTVLNDLDDPSHTGSSTVDNHRWPSASDVDASIADLEALLGTALTPARAQEVQDALVALKKISVGSDAEKSYSDTSGAFHQAYIAMTTLAPPKCKFAEDSTRQQGDPVCDSFELTQVVQCHGVFGGNDSALTLHISPAVSFPGAPSQAAQTVDLGTMTCSAPIAFSAGAAFSNINERDYTIGQVTTTTTTTNGNTTATSNQFQLAAQGEFSPLPMGFAHARVYEFQEGQYSLHATVGVGAHIRSQSSGGSDPEYIVGGSFSLWRVIYLTGGVDFGSSVSLANGYTVGGTVPSNITQPPLQVNRAVGVAFAISFSTTPK